MVMSKNENNLFDANQLIKDFELNVHWNRLIPEKSHSFFHPIDDKNFEQTDIVFLNSSVLFEISTLLENVLAASQKLCFDAFMVGYEPLAFVVDVAASWPERSPEHFPWRELMPQLAEVFSYLGLPVTIGNVRALSRTDLAYQYDSFSILLIAKRKVDFQENVIAEWPVYMALPNEVVYGEDNDRINKGVFSFLIELTRRKSLRFSAELNNVSDVLSQALLVSKRGLRIQIENLKKGYFFIIPDEGKHKEVSEIAMKWGFDLINTGNVELGQTLTLTQGEGVIASFPKSNYIKEANANFNKSDFTVCQCVFPTWLPDQEEEDAEVFKELALSVFFHPMHLGQQGLARVFDSTINQIFPSVNNVQNAVLLRYRTLIDTFGLKYYWLPSSAKHDNCHLQEYLANALRELVCSGLAPKAVVANYMGDLDYHRQACIKSFCSDFNLNYQSQLYPVKNQHDWQKGMGLVILGEPINSDLPKNQSFKKKGDLVFIIGKSISNLSGSVFQLVSQAGSVGAIPPVNLTMEKRIVDLIIELWDRQLIEMASSIGRGGLFTALTTSALTGNVGFDITTDAELRSDSFLFSEAPGRVIVSVTNENEAAFIDLLIEKDISFSILGHITKDELRIDDLSYGFIADFKQMMLQGWNAIARG